MSYNILKNDKYILVFTNDLYLKKKNVFMRDEKCVVND